MKLANISPQVNEFYVQLVEDGREWLSKEMTYQSWYKDTHSDVSRKKIIEE